MADQIGFIDVPEAPSTSDVFPITTEYGYQLQHRANIVTHQFFSANAKITQRYLISDPAVRRFTVVRQQNPLDAHEFDLLRDFWEARTGPYESFLYNAPSDDGQTTVLVPVRFESAPLSFDHFNVALITTGVTLIEVPDPDGAPIYGVREQITRFPDSELGYALADQVQILIPLLRIAVKEPGYPEIFVSDRRCSVGGNLYLPRLLRWDGISQGINGESDAATFVLGNADRVMRDLSFDTDLRNASVDFSLYHVQSQYQLHLWSGRVGTDNPYDYTAGPEFTLRATDFMQELSLSYPPRTISPQCWKQFDDDFTCPYRTNGTPGFTTCGRSFLDCTARGMTPFFGGIEAEPVKVFLKDNSSGAGRRLLAPMSLVNPGANGIPLQEIYTDISMPVNCIIAAARPESEFFEALGIVGAGPIGEFDPDFYRQTLDNQSAHGNPLPLGLRRGAGHDPVRNMDPDGDSDKFGLGQVDPSNPHGSIYPKSIQAAGVAFMEIRRTETEPGLHLSQVTDHQMQAYIKSGLRGWVWSAPGDRFEDYLTNPIWVCINMWLRAKGLHVDTSANSIAHQEATFDVQAAVDAANICNNLVDRSDAVPGLFGQEKQFTFRGVVSDQRTLKDWLVSVLQCCLGYYVQSMGKLKLGIRVNSSAVSAFTIGNTIAESVHIAARNPEYNSVTVTFGNSEFNWQPDSYTIDDFTQQRRTGGAYPQRLNSALSLVGCSTKPMAGRIAITRLREELGGISPAEWRTASTVELRTTVLGLDCEIGQIVSYTGSDAPNGYIEFRIERWALNSDYSITISGRSTTDSMYDLVVGPKPADIRPSPVPAERHWDTLPPQPWFPYQEQPNALDPLYSPTDWSFGLQQLYETAADGTALAKLGITGLHPTTQILGGSGPRINTYSTSSLGGTIPAGKHVVIALTAIDAAGNETASSQPAALPVDAITDTNKVVLSDIDWPQNTSGYRLYASTDHNLVSLQAEDFGSQPTEVDVTSTANVRTKGLPRPDLESLFVRVKVREHAGVVGLPITAVGAGTITVAGIGWADDEWTGRIASIITDASDGSAQQWNFTITGNILDTLEVTPDPQVAGVEPPDVLTIRTQATIFSELTIGDAKFQNTQYPSGANPGEEVGRVVRIIAGTGAGQERRISDNDQISLTVASPWITVPDETSVFVVDRPVWEYVSAVSDLPNETVNGILSMSVPIDNFKERTVLVEVVAVGHDRREPLRQYNPWREIYVYGSPGNMNSILVATY